MKNYFLRQKVLLRLLRFNNDRAGGVIDSY